MRKFVIVAALALPVLAGGCVSTAVSVVKAPFKVAGKAADWATTSQDEADRAAGRKLRKKEEAEGKKAREEKKRRDRDPDRD